MRMIFSRRATSGAGLPSLAISGPATIVEGTGGTNALVFTVIRSGATEVAVSCAWAATGTGANPVSGSDVAGGVLPSGTLSFGIGETSKSITVDIATDAIAEADEQISLTLSSPIGALIAGASASTIITNDDASAPFTPQAMARTPVRAWDTSAGVAASSGAISSIAGAWGRSEALTGVASPAQLVAGGPQQPGTTAPDMIGLTAASSQYFTFPQLDLATTPSDMEFWCAFALKNTSGGQFFTDGTGSLSSCAVNVGLASLNLRCAASSNITVNLPFTLSLGTFYVLRVRYDQAAGTFTASVNGIAGTASTAISGSTGGLKPSTLGRVGGSYGNVYFGPAMFFNAQLSTSDATNLQTYMARWISTHFWGANAGSDSNTGWNQASAWATADKFVSLNPQLGPGLTPTYAPKGGDVFRRTAMASLPYCIMDGGLWGTGYADFRGSILPTDWALVSGTPGTPGCVYARAEAQHPYYGSSSSTNGCIWDSGAAEAPTLASLAPTATNYLAWHKTMDAWCAANPNGRRLKDGGLGAAPAAGSYGYSGTTIYVALADGGNPNGRVEIAYRTTSTATASQMQAMFQAVNAGTILRRMRIRYVDGAAATVAGAGSKNEYLDVAYCLADGLDYTGAGQKLENSCRVLFVGTGATDGSDGDASSNHGGSMLRTASYYGWADRGGIDDVEQCSSDNYFCRGFGRRPFMSPGNGTGVDAARGTQNFWSCVGTIPDQVVAPGSAYIVHNKGTIMNLYGCTLVGYGTATGKTGLKNELKSSPANSTPTTTVKDCIVKGVAKIFDRATGNGTITEDYNCLVGTYGDGGPIGTHSITSDPAFTDAANFDYSLPSSSPCKGAGVALSGLTTDYAGVTRATPPSIGAVEAG